MVMSQVIKVFLVIFSLLSIASTDCSRRMCHGDVGNLAAGRSVQVSSWCGEDIIEEDFYTTTDGCVNNTQRHTCDIGAHPPMHMIDSPFINRNTWWQSKAVQPQEHVEILFDLETSFYFTHLIMVFHSVRPGAMTLERSVDNGATWQIYKYFARNCSEVFGLEDDENNFRSLCTSKYSLPEPCTKGEIIYRVLNPTKHAQDPYSARLQHLLKITNLRIQMWLPQQCGECTSEGFQYISIYDMIVRGTCFCNGHADSCTALHNGATEPMDAGQSVVHGKCMCEHHTMGDHCEICAPLYNDAPWRPANGETGEANACKKCNCHGHARACAFDIGVWRLNEETTGGVCLNCSDNTMGRQCQLCVQGYFRTPDSELTDPDVCQACECDGTGTIRDNNDQVFPCDPATGQCRCKEGVGGRRCNRCLHGFGRFSASGCVECLCERCDHVTGACLPDYGDEFDGFYRNVEAFDPRGDILKVPTLREPAVDVEAFQYRGPYGPFDAPYAGWGYSGPTFPKYSFEGSRTAAAHVSWKPGVECVCKEKDVKEILSLCRKDFDYAIKARVLKTEDFGSYIHIHVSIKRVFKEGKIRLNKKKMMIFPASWMEMGCTCPVLIPNREYVILGSEDLEKKRLVVDMKSFVKQWTHGKHWIRHVVKMLRNKKCKT